MDAEYKFMGGPLDGCRLLTNGSAYYFAPVYFYPDRWSKKPDEPPTIKKTVYKLDEKRRVYWYVGLEPDIED